MKKWRKNEGFTLVELIVVIAVLGVLTAVAVPAYNGYITKANSVADSQVCSAVLTAAQASLAELGTVDKVEIYLPAEGEKTVKAWVGEQSYTLIGTDDNSDEAVKSDFAMYFSEEELGTAFQTRTGSDDELATKAIWEKASGAWKFS